MILNRRVLALAPLGAALASCTRPELTPGLGARPLVLEDAFRGRLVGEGRFVSRIGLAPRGVTVDMAGSWDGRVLTLVEDFVYSDGERDRLTWRFTRIAPGRYAGTREDVIGEADVRQDGDAVRLSYEANVKSGSGRQRVRFEDVLYLRADGTIMNVAVVSVLGVPVGDVELVIRKKAR